MTESSACSRCPHAQIKRPMALKNGSNSPHRSTKVAQLSQGAFGPPCRVTRTVTPQPAVRPEILLSLWFRGAGEGTRTPDPIITNDVLYQLSYTGPASVLETDRIRPKARRCHS